MEYLDDRGTYQDLPLARIFADFDHLYASAAFGGPAADDPAFTPEPAAD